MENFIYIIEDLKTKHAAVVDPAWEPNKILALAQQHDLQITDILLTHSHHDHINAIDEILEHVDAQLHLTHDEHQFWGQKAMLPHLHYGGDQLILGQTRIEILHTPGHTPGSACYQVNHQLITGDTMFVFGCGRCDLAGGDPNVMFNTLNKLRRDLPQQTQVLPGHNYALQATATFKEQIQGNPFLHFSQQADFVAFRSHLHGKLRSSPYAPVSEQTLQQWMKQNT